MRLARPALGSAVAFAAALACAPEAAAQKYGPHGDIWKYQVPKHGIHGEFDNEDVMGVIAGKHIKTDCSVNVVKGGKTYCFTAAASQTFFKYAPNTNLEKAHESWERMTSEKAMAAPSQ